MHKKKLNYYFILLALLAPAFAKAQMIESPPNATVKSYRPDLVELKQYIVGGYKPFKYDVANSLNRIHSLFNEGKKYFSHIQYTFDEKSISRNARFSGTPAAVNVYGSYCLYYFNSDFHKDSFVKDVRSVTGMDQDDVLTWIAAHETFHCFSESDLLTLSMQGRADSILVRLAGVNWSSYDSPTARSTLASNLILNEKRDTRAFGQKYWQESVSDVAALITLQLINKKYNRPLLSYDGMLKLAKYRGSGNETHESGNSIKMLVQKLKNKIVRIEDIKSLHDIAQLSYEICFQAIRFPN